MRKKIVLIIGCIVLVFCAIIVLKCFEGDDMRVNNFDSEQSIKINLKGEVGEIKSNHIDEVINFLSTSGKLGENIDAKEEFILKKREVDSLGFTHYKLQQVVKEIPVYDGELIVHVKDNKKIYLINGNYHSNAKKVKINLDELLNKSELEKKAVKAIKSCKKKKAQIGELLVYPVNGEYTLVYEVEVDCILSADKIYRVFIDGYTGEVYDYYNIVQTK